MENVETKKKINRLGPTIATGIFISIAVLLTILSLTMNLKVAVEQYIASIQESTSESEHGGEMVLVATLVASIGLVALFIFYYGMLVVPHVIAAFCLIPVVKTLRNPDNKAIRIINFIYLGLIGIIIITTIIKFILYVAGVA